MDNALPAILRALAAAGLAGLLVILFGETAVPNITPRISLPPGSLTCQGMLGRSICRVPDRLATAITCAAWPCTLADPHDLHDGCLCRLPYASAIAKAYGKSKTPLVPSLVIGVIMILLLVLNVGNQRAFFVLISVAIIMFYIAYLCVTGPLLIARLRGKWPTTEHGPYFNRPLWAAGAPAGRYLPDRRHDQPGLAAPGGLRRRPLVLPVGAFTFTGVLGLGIVYYLVKPRAARRRCWPSTGPVPQSRRSASATRQPEPDPVPDIAGFLGPGRPSTRSGPMTWPASPR